MTEVRKAVNRVNFMQPEDEVLDGDEMVGLGVLGTCDEWIAHILYIARTWRCLCFECMVAGNGSVESHCNAITDRAFFCTESQAGRGPASCASRPVRLKSHISLAKPGAKNTPIQTVQTSLVAGREGSGKLRVAASQTQKSKLQAKANKRFKAMEQKGGAVSGLASSLAFTPIQVTRAARFVFGLIFRCPCIERRVLRRQVEGGRRQLCCVVRPAPPPLLVLSPRLSITLQCIIPSIEFVFEF